MSCNHPEEHFLFPSMTSSLLLSVRKYANATPPPTPTSMLKIQAHSLPLLGPPHLHYPNPIFPYCHCVSVNKSFIFPFTSTSRHLFALLPAVLYKPGVVHNGNGWGLNRTGEGGGIRSFIIPGCVLGGTSVWQRGRRFNAQAAELGVLRGNCFCVSPLPAALTLLAAEITLIAF